MACIAMTSFFSSCLDALSIACDAGASFAYTCNGGRIAFLDVAFLGLTAVFFMMGSVNLFFAMALWGWVVGFAFFDLVLRVDRSISSWGLGYRVHL